VQVGAVDPADGCAEAACHLLQRPAREQTPARGALLEAAQDRAAIPDLSADAQSVQDQHRVAPKRDTGAQLDLRELRRALEHDVFDPGPPQSDRGGQPPNSSTDYDHLGHLGEPTRMQLAATGRVQLAASG
jgi:hypothetical protein